jgi:cellulose synthase/poly-beta-1,6-N-acetylglucosamine synthase-like glycosyltransferase
MKKDKNSLKIVIVLYSFMVAISLILVTFLNFYILLIADVLPAAVSTAYLLIRFKKQKNSFIAYNKKTLPLPFVFFGLIIIPLTITIITSIVFTFDIYLIVISIAMPLTLMNIFFYLPLAIYDKYFSKRISLPSLNHTITVIIPAFNEEVNIKRTLDSIIEADYPNKEIIVVDDGSTDKTYSIVSKYKEKLPRNRFSVIRKPNGGKASAINLALRFAKGEIVIVVDADSIIEKEALQKIANEFNNPDVVAVAGRIKVPDRFNVLTNCIALEIAVGTNFQRPPFSLFGVVTIVPGAIGGFRKSSIIQRGLYDKDTLTEDFDLTIKLLKGGGSIVATHAVSYTENPRTLKDLYKQRIRWNRGNFQTILKHKDIMTTPRYGMLHKFAYPITLVNFVLPPIMDILISTFLLLAILDGMSLLLILPFTLIILMQIMLSAFVLAIDGTEDLRLIFYSPFAIVGYKQIINGIIIKSMIDVFFRKNLKWTSTVRKGVVIDDRKK